MTTDLARPLIRLRSPSDIVEVVPYLVGFQPEDSLVVVSLRGERLRVGLTARVDLPPAESAETCAREFVGYLKRDNAARAVVVFYPPSGGRHTHPFVRSPTLSPEDSNAPGSRWPTCCACPTAAGGRCIARTTTVARQAGRRCLEARRR